MENRETKTGMETATGVRNIHRKKKKETYTEKHGIGTRTKLFRERNGTETNGNGFSEKRMGAETS